MPLAKHSRTGSGVPYMIEDGRTRLLVPPNDHEALARAALRLLDEENLAAALAQNAFAECARYEPAHVARDWIALYRRLGQQVQN